LHCKPNGDPFYVGKGIVGRGKRSHDFKYSRSAFYKNTVNKIGLDNIEVMVFPCESEQIAFYTEIKWIKVLRDAGYKLVNLTDGGDGVSGMKHSIETRLKLSKPRSEASRAKMIGNKNAAGNKNMLGHKASAETLEKMSIRMMGNKCSLGHIQTEEHKNNISISLKGKIKSQETRDKLSIALKGNKNCLGRVNGVEFGLKISKALIGKKLSVAHCESMSKARKGFIMPQSTKDKIAISVRKTCAMRRHSKSSVKMKGANDDN
jgi:hypothetical protein